MKMKYESGYCNCTPVYSSHISEDVKAYLQLQVTFAATPPSSRHNMHLPITDGP